MFSVRRRFSSSGYVISHCDTFPISYSLRLPPPSPLDDNLWTTARLLYCNMKTVNSSTRQMSRLTLSAHSLPHSATYAHLLAEGSWPVRLNDPVFQLSSACSGVCCAETSI